MNVIDSTSAAPVEVTDSAIVRIEQIARAEGRPNLGLRISVAGGGCSGFQYGFVLDDQQVEDDIVIARAGVRVMIDPVSLEYLKGSVVDFVEDLVGASFQVRNPNAKSSCGCGTSFAI